MLRMIDRIGLGRGEGGFHRGTCLEGFVDGTFVCDLKQAYALFVAKVACQVDNAAELIDLAAL